ncbi:MAG TPA: ABC transporter substrate-binding protein, partial [Cupriavidus sp.]|nr:ABC transporter substrate-binding protein [Cupriavidus sp.]
MPNFRMRRTLAVAILALPAAAISLPASANDAYPSRPIRLVVPFAAGSGTDAVARITAKELGDALNQNVIVDNRPGANGAIAAE